MIDRGSCGHIAAVPCRSSLTLRLPVLARRQRPTAWLMSKVRLVVHRGSTCVRAYKALQGSVLILHMQSTSRPLSKRAVPPAAGKSVFCDAQAGPVCVSTRQ